VVSQPTFLDTKYQVQSTKYKVPESQIQNFKFKIQVGDQTTNELTGRLGS
jgi:hypothetical protein